MKPKIIAIAAALSILFSCSNTQTRKNEQIEKAIQDAIEIYEQRVSENSGGKYDGKTLFYIDNPQKQYNSITSSYSKLLTYLESMDQFIPKKIQYNRQSIEDYRIRIRVLQDTDYDNKLFSAIEKQELAEQLLFFSATLQLSELREVLYDILDKGTITDIHRDSIKCYQLESPSNININNIDIDIQQIKSDNCTTADEDSCCLY